MFLPIICYAADGSERGEQFMTYMGEIFQFSLGQFFLESNLVGPSYPVQVIEHDGIKDQNDESYIGTVCPPCFVPSRLL